MSTRVRSRKYILLSNNACAYYLCSIHYHTNSETWCKILITDPQPFQLNGKKEIGCMEDIKLQQKGTSNGSGQVGVLI